MLNLLDSQASFVLPRTFQTTSFEKFSSATLSFITLFNFFLCFCFGYNGVLVLRIWLTSLDGRDSCRFSGWPELMFRVVGQWWRKFLFSSFLFDMEIFLWQAQLLVVWNFWLKRNRNAYTNEEKSQDKVYKLTSPRGKIIHWKSCFFILRLFTIWPQSYSNIMVTLKRGLGKYQINGATLK